MTEQATHTADARDWRELFQKAFETVDLATDYADDGAYLTAADRLESAAKLFREGYGLRLDKLEGRS